MIAPVQPMTRPYRIGVVFGTRPEVIKLYPVLAALQSHVEDGSVVVRTISTGQQRELLAQVLRLFDCKADYDFDLMRDGQALAHAHARMVTSLTGVYHDEHFDRVLVQGDTLTSFSAAMCAFYAQIPVAHIEAGLRTWDIGHPYPEEVHRRWISACSDIHFCPTESARRNLMDEGIPARDTLLVGNTVIDAMRLVEHRVAPPSELPSPRGRRLFVTVHRRENHARLEEDILPAIAAIVCANPDLDVVVSMHPNPCVLEPTRRALGHLERVHLTEPLDYTESLGLVRQSTLVVTDSGGLQEEATALGTPVLVVRRLTERMEAVSAGNALVIGTTADEVANRIQRVLDDDALRARMSVPSEVFGDGHAADRIVAHLLEDL